MSDFQFVYPGTLEEAAKFLDRLDDAQRAMRPPPAVSVQRAHFVEPPSGYEQAWVLVTIHCDDWKWEDGRLMSNDDWEWDRGIVALVKINATSTAILVRAASTSMLARPIYAPCVNQDVVQYAERMADALSVETAHPVGTVEDRNGPAHDDALPTDHASQCADAPVSGTATLERGLDASVRVFPQTAKPPTENGPVASPIEDDIDEPTLAILRDTKRMRRYHPDYSVPTAMRILRAVPKAHEDFVKQVLRPDAHERFQASDVANVAGLSKGTVGHYLRALRKAGITEYQSTPLP